MSKNSYTISKYRYLSNEPWRNIQNDVNGEFFQDTNHIIYIYIEYRIFQMIPWCSNLNTYNIFSCIVYSSEWQLIINITQFSDNMYTILWIISNVIKIIHYVLICPYKYFWCAIFVHPIILEITTVHPKYRKWFFSCIAYQWPIIVNILKVTVWLLNYNVTFVYYTLIYNYIMIWCGQLKGK